MTTDRGPDEVRSRRDLHWLKYAVHELPAGVLCGPGAAMPKQCAHIVDRLGLSGHTEFIEACRWHLEHYPHYLGRRRHFVDYATYVRDPCGPLTVESPRRSRDGCEVDFTAAGTRDAFTFLP